MRGRLSAPFRSRVLLDLVANAAAVGVHQQRDAVLRGGLGKFPRLAPSRRARAGILNELDHPLKRQVAAERAALERMKRLHLEGPRQLDRAEPVRATQQGTLQLNPLRLEKRPELLPVVRHGPRRHLARQVTDERGHRAGIPAGLRRRPQHGLVGQGSDVGGQDPVTAERVDEGQAVVGIVVGREVGVRRHHGAQKVAERHLDGRDVVERAQAHREHPLRRPGRFARKAVHQVGMEAAFRQEAGAPGRYPTEVADPGFVDHPECVEHRGYEGVAPLVRFEPRGIRLGIRLPRVPLPLRVGLTQGVAKAVALAQGLTELGSDGAEHAARVEAAANRGELVSQHLGRPEMLEQGHQIGEGFVKGADVRVAPFERDPHPGQQGVRQLVRDHVLRQAREHRRSGKGRLRPAFEIAEAEPLLWIPMCVLLLRVMRMQLQSLLVCVRRRHAGIYDGARLGRPVHDPAERSLEVADGAHRHGVHHLLSELGIAVRRRQTVLREDLRVVEIRPAGRPAFPLRSRR